jgi:hypothetical protein
VEEGRHWIGGSWRSWQDASGRGSNRGEAPCHLPHLQIEMGSTAAQGSPWRVNAAWVHGLLVPTA